ncbi:MAG: DUF1284 domain-containing protein [Ruminococcus sp.]|nr:DUF1284 domain-containing protein [Ruminococcus sp.]MBR1750682.1 DUF1284 domain-containing protein [Ruminococcus sp.]MBR1753126.1 DUF1284 domain-containing protein [Ruminococcus sp.]
MTAVIPLRPHHILCIGFFEGKGYSDDFVQNMYHVISQLDNNAFIQLTMQADVVCSRCPLDTNGVCSTDKKAASYDAAVLRLTGLSSGSTYTWDYLRSVIKEKILSCGDLFTVCGTCKWYEICSNKNTAKGQ